MVISQTLAVIAQICNLWFLAEVKNIFDYVLFLLSIEDKWDKLLKHVQIMHIAIWIIGETEWRPLISCELS